MRFAVPQFIDVEDTLFGSITLKQAIYLAGGVGIVLALFVWLGFFWALLLGGPVFLFSFALAFVKINSRPFVNIVYAAVVYTVKSKLYLWKRTKKSTNQKKQENNTKQETNTPTSQHHVPNMTQSRLREIAWTLDTQQEEGNSLK